MAIAKYHTDNRILDVWRQMFRLESIEDRFLTIYTKNLWDNAESVSGSGSTLHYTENIRRELPRLIDEFSIKSIFDAPCGDFNWMSRVLPTLDVRYIGADIVKPLVEANKSKYSDARTTFVHINLTKGQFPDVDLMICRDCLFHFSYEDTRALLSNFAKSNIKYLLTTTYPSSPELRNEDVLTGDFRPIDLFSSPYNFPSDPLFTIEDWIPPEQERKLCLWTRDQVVKAFSCFGESAG